MCAMRDMSCNVSTTCHKNIHRSSHSQETAMTLLLDGPPGDISTPSGDEYKPDKNGPESEDNNNNEMDVPSEKDIQQQAKKKSKKKSNKRSDVFAAHMVPPKDNQGKHKISASSTQDLDDLLDVYVLHFL